MKKLVIVIFLGILLGIPVTMSAAGDSYLKLYNQQGHRSPEWNELIEPGFQAFDAGNLPTARVFLQKAYSKGCRDGLVLYRLAVVNEAGGNLKEALLLMVEAQPKLLKDYQNLDITKGIDGHLGQLYYQNDQFAKALPFLKAAIAGSPQDFTLLFIAGQVMRAEGKTADAYATYQKAFTATPPADARYDPTMSLIKELMVTAYELKRYDEALGWADKILEKDPSNALAQSYRQQIRQLKVKQQQEEKLLKTIEQY